MAESFWERPEILERFAASDRDEDLAKLAETYDVPAKTRALDLGCAGGRNTEFLAAAGFDVWALDSSPVMVEHTRERVAPVLGPDAARERVLLGRMDDLSMFADGSFDLVVAFGVYHNASTWDEWQRAISETARVMAPGGKLMVYHFTPETDFTGEGVQPVPNEPHTFDGLGHGRGVLLYPTEIDAEMARHGLSTVRPTEVVVREMDPGRRVILDALYVRDGSSASA